MKITGYSDRWSAAAGERIGFFVHCVEPRYRVDLVRLIHGDENPRGPGFKEQEIQHPVCGDYPGQRQPIRPGSRAVVEAAHRPVSGSFTVAAWVWPTAPERGPSRLISLGDPEAGTGFALGLDAAGNLEFVHGNGADAPVRLRLDRPLIARDWYLVGASHDAETGGTTLFRFTSRETAGEPHLVKTARTEPTGHPVETPHAEGPARIVFAASWPEDADAPCQHFNGKIGGPALFGAALSARETWAWAAAGGLHDDPRLAARWDFSQAIGSERIVDAGPHGLHGSTRNRPTRGVTGANWSGNAPGFAQVPNDYDAIHFHDDDVGDVRWQESLSFSPPADLPSGVYALRLRCAGGEDHLPFVVRPALGKAGARVAFLMPTLSYLAYANESLDVSDGLAQAPLQDMGLQPERYAYMQANALKSTYDVHTDGSGICMASLHRPVLDFRPRARCRTFDAPHGFPADLYLVDWLETKGFDFDVITDHDLNADGADLLAPYDVILTGSHPEYWTAAMLDSRDRYLNNGGRLMYLGGNGFYWVTAVDPEDPGQLEIRRHTGTRSWQAEPGEFQISLTGEMGGLWRDRGRAPQKTVGVGFTGQGFDRNAPYQRKPDSRDPRAAFVFEGVSGDVFGAGPSLVLNHGAGGFEVDRANRRLGTPAHALVLASTTGHSDAYQVCIEEQVASLPNTGGTANAYVGADIVLLPYPNGGAVFSVGSIAWSGSLSADAYGSDVSRITENVLRAFTADGQPPWQGG